MPRILVVDDDQPIRTLVTAIFEMQGIECVAAAGGEEALRRLAAETFDLVLLDLMMPDVDGFAVLDALRQPHPPIMIATAASPRVVEKLDATRIAAFVGKPFDVNELIATAKKLLNQSVPASPPPIRKRNDLRIHREPPLPVLGRPPLPDIR
jgi:two-component system response regulator CpxR